MKYRPILNQAILVKRYKRFLADVVLENGEEVTIYCPNTGSMKNCWDSGANIWYSESDNKKRKYPYTWEIVETPAGHKAGINTIISNKLVREAIENGTVTELGGYNSIRAEVPYGDEKSRIDFLLERIEGEEGVEKCYVEVKNVTLFVGKGRGEFPDSVSSRGTKHLRELIAMVKAGHRAVLFYCVQHTGINVVSPADEIDPLYGETLRKAIEVGVEVLAYSATISAQEIKLTKPVVFECV